MNPTHVEITVILAKRLVNRGKHDTNDAFVSVEMGKEKFETSVKERATDPVLWNEAVTLEIPKQGNTAAITLTVHHRKFFGEDFLGMALIYLKDFQPSSQPKRMTYNLQGRADGKEDKWRIEGEIHVGITFKQLGGLETGASRLSLRSKGLREIAEELIQKKRMEGLKRSASIRSIASALMGEKRRAALTAPAPIKEYDIEMTDTDDNDNVLPPAVQSARGRNNSVKLSITPEYQTHAKLSTSSASSNEVLFENVRAPSQERSSPRPITRKLSNISESTTGSSRNLQSESAQRTDLRRSETDLNPTRKVSHAHGISTNSCSPIQINVDEDSEAYLPLEFRGQSKQALVRTILNLRETVQLHEERIADLEDYIDYRLSKIMNVNPTALEAPKN